MSVSVSGGLREMQSTWPAFKAAKNGRTKPLRLMLLLALAELFEFRHVFCCRRCVSALTSLHAFAVRIAPNSLPPIFTTYRI